MTAIGAVDAHSHLFPQHWARHGHMPPDMFDVDALLAAQAAAGLACTVISDPHIWYGDLDPSDIVRTREYNDFAAELTRAHAPRIAALGSVTPWRGDEHVREAERAVRELGLSGLADPDERRRPLPRQRPGQPSGSSSPASTCQCSSTRAGPSSATS